MPPIDRSGGRNVHIYDAENPTVVLGGLILNNGITNANLYSMLDIFIVYEESFSSENEEPFLLQDENGTGIQKNNHPLRPGKYYIVSASKILFYPFIIYQLSSKQVPFKLVMSQSYFVRFLFRPELEFDLSVTLYVHEIVDVWCLGERL